MDWIGIKSRDAALRDVDTESGDGLVVKWLQPARRSKGLTSTQFKHFLKKPQEPDPVRNRLANPKTNSYYNVDSSGYLGIGYSHNVSHHDSSPVLLLGSKCSYIVLHRSLEVTKLALLPRLAAITAGPVGHTPLSVYRSVEMAEFHRALGGRFIGKRKERKTKGERQIKWERVCVREKRGMSQILTDCGSSKPRKLITSFRRFPGACLPLAARSPSAETHTNQHGLWNSYRDIKVLRECLLTVALRICIYTQPGDLKYTQHAPDQEISSDCSSDSKTSFLKYMSVYLVTDWHWISDWWMDSTSLEIQKFKSAI